jgi:hypothetical protein
MYIYRISFQLKILLICTTFVGPLDPNVLAHHLNNTTFFYEIKRIAKTPHSECIKRYRDRSGVTLERKTLTDDFKPNIMILNTG